MTERRTLSEFLKNNEPQINTDERRFNNRVSAFIRALKSVFAPFASSAVRLKYAPTLSDLKEMNIFAPQSMALISHEKYLKIKSKGGIDERFTVH